MLQQAHRFFLDLFFPPACVGCQQADTWFCEACFDLISPQEKQYCYQCQSPSPLGQTCASHQETELLDGLLVAAHYDGNPLLKKALHELKYGRHPEDTAQKLSRLLSPLKDLHQRFEHVEIIPVPLHETRLQERGFNQTELLSRRWKQESNTFLTINTELLKRIRNTTSQVKTAGRKGRLKNLKDAFEVTKTIDPETCYVLVDDVATTGATLEECSATLRKAGTKTVWGMVLARN